MSAKPDQLYVNFGFWDMVPTTRESGHYNRMIERKIAELGGAKGLYSSSYYDKRDFLEYLRQGSLRHLKQTYDPDSVFPDLYAKCVERR